MAEKISWLFLNGGFNKVDGSGFFAKFDVSQKESINIKIQSCHLVDLEEGNTLELFSARGTIWLKRYGWKDMAEKISWLFLNGGFNKVDGSGFFANEEFLRFLLVSLRFCYIQKKIIDSKVFLNWLVAS